MGLPSICLGTTCTQAEFCPHNLLISILAPGNLQAWANSGLVPGMVDCSRGPWRVQLLNEVIRLDCFLRRFQWHSQNFCPAQAGTLITTCTPCFSTASHFLSHSMSSSCIRRLVDCPCCCCKASDECNAGVMLAEDLRISNCPCRRIYPRRGNNAADSCCS